MYKDGNFYCNACRKMLTGQMFTRLSSGKKLTYCSQECNVRQWKGNVRTLEQEAEYQEILQKTGIDPEEL